MAGSIVGTVYETIVKSFQEPVATYAKAIGSAIQPLVMSCFLLYILYLVYRLYTKKDFMVEEIINAIMLFTVVGVFTFAGTYYYDYIIPFVTNSGDELAQSLSNTSSINAVDSVYNSLESAKNELSKELDKSSGWFSGFEKLGTFLKIAFPWLALFLAQLLFSVVIAINLLIAKIMVSLLLSTGIIFFAFSAFTPTRQLFSSFTGLCLNYILLNVMYSVAANLTGEFIKKQIADDTTSLIAASGQVLIIIIIVVLAINQIPTLVSSLTGGVGISPFTISSSGISKAAGALGLGKAARFAGNKTAKGAGNVARKAWNRFRGKGSVNN